MEEEEPMRQDDQKTARNTPASIAPPRQGAKLMEGERVVFSHEIEPSHGVRIVTSGEVDESVLDALEVFVQL